MFTWYVTVIMIVSKLFIHMIIKIGCVEGEVRLVGGSNYTEGRVEICMSNEWGTVCDQQWNSTDASVVCRQLSLSSIGNKYLSGRITMFAGYSYMANFNTHNIEVHAHYL